MCAAGMAACAIGGSRRMLGVLGKSIKPASPVKVNSLTLPKNPLSISLLKCAAIGWAICLQPAATSCQSAVISSLDGSAGGGQSLRLSDSAGLANEPDMVSLPASDADQADQGQVGDLAALHGSAGMNASVGTETTSGAAPEVRDLQSRRNSNVPGALLPATYNSEDMSPVVGQIGFVPMARQGSLTLAGSVLPMQPTTCQIRVLSALNRRFPNARVTPANIVPTKEDKPAFAVANVNIAGPESQLASVNKGRYLYRRRSLVGLVIGYGPSLHIVAHPSFLDPHALVFSRTLFTAHLDSAWADTPVGLVLHFLIDVIRPEKRNPCP